eukprot:9646296-Alexandrium_andersonii.AAC.1
MSASLVGSEMCIRDRRGRGRKPPEAVRDAGEGPWPPRQFVTRAKGPVSYTHLTLPTICSV